MATRNSSRSGGNRPRTHPTRSVKTTKTRRFAAVRPAPAHAPDLFDIRAKLEVVHSVATTVVLALERSNTEYDGDLATTLKRCVLGPLWVGMLRLTSEEHE